ncbi:hypothetical protein JCM10207_008861 [Rhodosporidiobolus poonsookiae]
MPAESLSRVPLLSHSDAEQADLSILALAHAYGALKAGKMPTTDQLVGGIRKILNSQLLQPDVGKVLAGKVGGGKLSARGRDVVLKERRALESVARLVLEKSGDDQIQRFIWQARNADVDVDVDVEAHIETPDIPLPSTDELKDVGHSLHELLSLLLTSSELRNLLADSLNLFRDLFADAAEGAAEVAISATRASKKAAREVRPSEEQKKQHETGLEGEHWEDVLGNVQDVRKQVRRGAEDKRDELLKRGVKKGRALKEYAEEHLPTDAKDAVIERWKKIVNEIQSKPEYQDAIHTLSHLGRKYFDLTAQELQKAAEQSTAAIKDADASTNKEAKTAVSLLREIVEQFTGPLDDALRAADALYNDLKGDERVQQVWKEFELLLERAIDEPGYVTSNKASRRFESIYDRARAIVESNADWKRDASAFANESSKLLNRAGNDKALLAVSDAFEDLGDSLALFAKTGFNLLGTDGGDLWKDISTVWLPRILSGIKMVPAPRIEFTSEDVDAVIDNIRFESASFIPDAAHFKSNIELSTRKGYAAYASEFATTTTLAFAGLRLQAKNISYYIKKKTGWIGLEDSGLLDIYIGTPNDPKAEDGLDVTLVLSNATEDDRESFFKLERVDVNIDNFSIGIRNSTHPIRNWFARGAVSAFLQEKTKEVLEEQISAGFKELDKQVYLLQYKAAGARAAAPDPLAYLRAVLTPTATSGSSLVDEITSTGITKVGPKGEWVLAIGVEEELLPGRRTALERLGEDVVTRKRQVESLLEEGRAELVGAVHEAAGSADNLAEAGYAVGEAVEEEGVRARRVKERREREERKNQDGWKSDAFDLVVE